MPYIGRDLNRGNYLKLDDISSSFNSSTKTFNLTVGGSAFTPGSAFSILVSVGGVIQEPESAYQVNNSEITFANAPTAQDGFFCLALGVPIGIGVPGNGTVNGTQMAKPFNYDGYFHLDDANNRVGINSSSPTVALDVIGNIKLNGNLVTGSGSGGLQGNVYAASGISTFYDVRVTNNLTVEGTTTTLDTNLIGVDRVEVGANSNSIVGMAVTQSGTADILNLYDGSTEVFSVADGGKVDILSTNNLLTLKKATNGNYCGIELDRDNSGTEGGTIGLAGGTGHFVTSAKIHDLTIRSANGNILFGSGQTEVLRTNPFGAKVTGILTATTFVGNGDFVDIDVDGRADLDDVVITGVTTTTNMVEISGASFDEGAVLTLRNTTAINNDENLANINVAANDGPSGFHTGAQIKFLSGSNWSDGATWTDIIFKHAKRTSGTTLVEGIKISGTASNVSSHVSIGSSILSNSENYYFAIKGYERSSQGASGNTVNLGIFNQSGAAEATANIDFRLGQATVSNTPAVRLLGGKQGGWSNTASTRDGYFAISVSNNAQLIDRFTIRSNGRVGIGTMLPDASLHVLSDADNMLQIESTDRHSTIYIVDSVGSSFIQNDSGELRFGVGGGASGSGGETEAVRIAADGKVGIGTDDPQKLLELKHIDNRKLQFSYDDNIITIKSSNNNGNPENLRFIGDDLIFHTGTSGSATEALRITDDRFVKINSASPVANTNGENALLQVKLLSQYDGLLLGHGYEYGMIGRGASNGALIYTSNASPGNLGGGEKIMHEWWSGSSGGGGPNSLMVLSSSSKLGIGVTNPDKELTIASARPTIKLIDSDVSNNAAFATIDASSHGGLLFECDPNNVRSGTDFRFNVDGDEKVRITSDGYVGIGSDTTDRQLAVYHNTQGTIEIKSSDTGQSSLWFSDISDGNVGGVYYEHGNDAMGFRINDLERVRINSTGKLKLPDNGEIQFGGSLTSGNGDFRIYHDSANSLNLITAATNFPIKISGGVEFFDYTGVTKRVVIDSNGLRIGTVSAPTLPTTGKQPMIMRNETYFTKEIHRTISDYRLVCDGTHAGYLLLVPAWAGSNTAGKKFYGTVMCDRGSTGSGNSTQFAKVHATTAYNNDKFYVEIDRHSQYICGASKVTFNGTNYLALRFNNGGGGPHAGIHIDGIYRGADSNFLKLVRENEVTVVDKHYGALATNPSGPPICGAFVTHMQGSTFDSGVLANGNVRYQHAPSGQSSPYNNSNGRFTAMVNGLYLVTGGVLVESGSGRLEGTLEWYNGSSWQTWVNFNGTGTTYDGTTFTCMIPLKEGYIIRMSRNSGNAYNSTHANHYFGVHLLNALRRDDVTI